MKRSDGIRVAVLALAVLAASAVGLAEEKKFVCSRDVWVSAVPTGDEASPSATPACPRPRS